MSGPDLVVRARRVVTPSGETAAAVEVRDGRIAAVGAYGDAPAGALTLADDEVLLPGLVDSHVHVNEPGRTEWEGFATATAAAAAGGVTTIVDMPLNSLPPTVDPEALAAKRAAAAGQVHVDVAFWGGAVPGNLGRLRALHDAGVAGVKCFLLDSGVPEFPPLDPGQLRAALAEVAAYDGLLIAHCEDPATVRPAPAGPDYGAFLRSRPPEAETRAVATLLDGARATGARVHVVHVSAAEVLPLLAGAVADGVRVTAETCPHYLTLAAEDVPAGATAVKCCPPVRGRANREALWGGLRAGTLACVVSDHSPSPAGLKHLDSGDFGAAWGGISSLQLALPLVWTGARDRGLTLPDVVRWMAEGPARLAGLAGKGRIAVGADADLVAFAPDETVVVDPARLRHRHPVSPYAGRPLRGVVRRTWVRGRETGGDPHGVLR
ncbi:MAG TPA: allantoinase AllB [Mycobacteriales bacterium]|nr:allantoinase AllB [Mycobacteriales bacterium]